MSGRLGTAGTVARGLLRRLPGARGAAAIGLLRDARVLVTGRGPATVVFPPGDRPVDPFGLVRARRAIAAGDDRAALAAADAILAREPDSLEALSIRRTALGRLGEPTAALATIRRIRAIADTAALAAEDDALQGELRLTDPRWTPRIPGTRPAAPEALPGVVLHLAWDAQAGGRKALRAVLAGQRAAGLEPVLVVGEGPTADPDGTTDAGGTADDATVRPLPGGPAWPASLPQDARVEQGAWLAGRIAAAERPAVLWVLARSGPAALLAGVALRDHLGIPLVVDRRGLADPGTDAPDAPDAPDVPDAPPGSERAARAAAVIARVAAAADAVVETGGPDDRAVVDALVATARQPDRGSAG